MLGRPDAELLSHIPIVAQQAWPGATAEAAGHSEEEP